MAVKCRSRMTTNIFHIMKNFRIKTILYILMLSVAAISCSEDKDSLTPFAISSADGKGEVSADGTEASAVIGPEGGSLHFTIVGDYRWDAFSDAEAWCSVEQANNKLAVLVGRFVGEEQFRTATVTVSDVGGRSAVIRITQNAEQPVDIFLTGESHRIPFRGGEIILQVESESDDIRIEVVDDLVPWLKADYDDKDRRITLSAGQNRTLENLSSTVVVTAGTGTNKATAEWCVKQENGAMMLRYKIIEESTVIALPLYGKTLCTVEWGDGETETVYRTVSDSYITHWFESPGSYDVTIRGNVEGLCSLGDDRVAEHLEELVQWGDVGLTSLNGAFANASLKSVPECDIMSFAEVTDVSGMFEGCASLGEVPVSLFDGAADITAFDRIFSGCSSLTGESPYTIIDGIRIHLYQRDGSGAFAVPVSYSGAFTGCSSLSDFDEIPQTWK